MCHILTHAGETRRHWGTAVSHLTITPKQSPPHTFLLCCSFDQPAPLLSHDFVLEGKHLRVNVTDGMLADETECFALEGGQCSSSAAERYEGQCYAGPASQCAFLFQLRNVNSLWKRYLWCIPYVWCTSVCFVTWMWICVDCIYYQLSVLLQVRVTCAPPTNPSGVWTTPRTWTPTGRWAAKRAPRAPCPPSCSWCSASPRTSSNPSSSPWSAAASNRARLSGFCSTRRRRTPSTRCSPTSRRPSSWTLEPWGGCTRWRASRWV